MLVHARMAKLGRTFGIRQYFYLLLAGVIVGLLGVAILVRSHAATIVVSNEVESGTVSGAATVINDASASQGKAVKFGSGLNGFITRSGTKLMLNGQQYKFAGVNANAMVFPACRGNSNFPTAAELDRYFSSLNRHSMTRVWYLSDAQPYQDALDRALASAEKYQQYIAVTLTDANSQCGDPINKSGTFWTSGFKGAYWTHVKNTVTRYKDRPGIGMWEMANEGNGGGNTNFYLETAAMIKGIDSKHLITTGSMPSYSFSSYTAYKEAHGANIDLVSVHEYDGNTGESHWVTGTGAQAAIELNKPVYVGEDGFCCGGGDTGTDSGNAIKLDAEYKAYLNDPLVAGMMYWNFDFVNKGDPTDMYFNTALFAVAGTIANPYPGGN
jgi:hypothetical protein